MELHDRRHCDLFAVANGVVYVGRFIDGSIYACDQCKVNASCDYAPLQLLMRWQQCRNRDRQERISILSTIEPFVYYEQ